MAKLNISVYVDGQRYDPGRHIPAEVAKKITNPRVWADKDPDEDRGDRDTGTPPPGPQQPTQDPNRPKLNATRELWAAYAASLTPPAQINGGMSRDEIIAAVDAAAKAGQGS